LSKVSGLAVEKARPPQNDTHRISSAGITTAANIHNPAGSANT